MSTWDFFSRTDLLPFRKSEDLVNFSLIDLCIASEALRCLTTDL